MKKSQVLAAIALAFALGLAPIASTFAVTSIKDQCDTAYKEAHDLIVDFGTSDQITTLTHNMDNLEAAYAPKAADLKAVIAGANAPTDTNLPVWTIVKNVLNAGATVNGKVLTVDDFTNKNFDQVIALGDSATYGEQNQAWYDSVVEAAKEAMAPYIEGVREALDAVELGDNLSDSADAKATIAYVESLPNYEKVVTLLDAFNKNVCAGTNDDMTKATENLNKAIAAYKNTTTPDGSGDAQKPVTPSTPETGANTASEESATASVSILSGVASVVTAAGVVIRKAFRK